MSDFETVHAVVLELDLDTCLNTFGVTPCTAGRSDTGTAQAGTASTITLAATASSVDDFYNTEVVRITGGTGSGQERPIIDYTGASRVADIAPDWATIPDATSTYDVIDRPNGCYNTFQNCQDTPNYVKGTNTLRFCNRAAPVPVGEQIRPYIDRIDAAPTEISIENGLASRASVSLRMLDEPDSDRGLDLYVDNRATVAPGSFWTRLLARTRNYAGRFARVRTAYLTGAWNFADFVDELYVIDEISGPDNAGMVKIVLKDPIKLTDRRKIPEPSKGKLASDLTAAALSMTLRVGAGAGYPAAGRVRVGKEVIEYTANSADVLSWPNVGGFRGRFGTTPAAANDGESVQLCRVWDNETVATVLDDLLSESGIAAANIDSAGFAAEDTDWLGAPYRITTCIPEPEGASMLLMEILVQVGGFMWFSPVTQKAKFKVLAPIGPTETLAATLSDRASVAEGTVKLRTLDDLRTTVRTMLYDIQSATADRREDGNYLRGEIFIDTDAESANEYNDRRVSLIRSRWFSQGNSVAVAGQVGRAAHHYRDAPRNLWLSVAPQDAALREGELVDLQVGQIVADDGRTLTVRAIILWRRDEAGRIALRLRVTTLNKRYAFIGPNTLPDYPAATADDKKYGFIAADANGFADGTTPYLII